MASHRLWYKDDPVAIFDQTFTVIDVFEPDRKEALVETAEFNPSAPAEHKECPGRLFHIRANPRRWLTVPPIDGVCGP
jgi:hypothetical protein